MHVIRWLLIVLGCCGVFAVCCLSLVLFVRCVVRVLFVVLVCGLWFVVSFCCFVVCERFFCILFFLLLLLSLFGLGCLSVAGFCLLLACLGDAVCCFVVWC